MHTSLYPYIHAHTHAYIQAAIANAKTLEEVNKLEAKLKSGEALESGDANMSVRICMSMSVCVCVCIMCVCV